MKLSKNSWHVKMNKEYGMDRVKYNLRYGNPVSLCDYFWSTVLTIVSLTFLSVVFTLGAGAMLYGLLCLVGILFSAATGIWFDFIMYDIGVGLIVVSFLFGVAMFIVSLFSNEVKWFPEYITKHFKQKEVGVKEKKPNLFFEWLKAMKDKVCPLIEIE